MTSWLQSLTGGDHELIISVRRYYELRRQVDDDSLPVGLICHPPQTLYGMKLIVSPQFPFETNCGTCGGTGEGTDATYCSRCKGAGRLRFEGMALPSRTMFTSPLPKAFEPYFPAGLVPPPRLCRGLP